MPQKEEMGWVKSYSQDSNCDNKSLPSYSLLSLFLSPALKLSTSKSAMTSNIPKANGSRYSFNMTCQQQVTLLAACFCLKCFLHLAPRAPCPLRTVRLPSSSFFSLSLWVLPDLCKDPNVRSTLRPLPYSHWLSKAAVLKHFGLRTTLTLLKMNKELKNALFMRVISLDNYYIRKLRKVLNIY